MTIFTRIIEKTKSMSWALLRKDKDDFKMESKLK